MIDFPITEVKTPLQLSTYEHRALYRLLRGYPTSRDRVTLAEAIERNITRRKFREDAASRLEPLSLDSYPET